MSTIRSSMAAMILAAALFALWGCPKKAEVTAIPEATDAQKARAQAAPKPEAPKVEPQPKAAPVETEEKSRERAAAAGQGLRPIYFDFDKSHIRDDAKSAMKANADWLKANPQATIVIEGNCDERGTIEYNQALGQRRAQSAKNYLIGLGVSAGRISLLSYGKEKPVCEESTEACWQKNRRAEFSPKNR